MSHEAAQFPNPYSAMLSRISLAELDASTSIQVSKTHDAEGSDSEPWDLYGLPRNQLVMVIS